MRERRNPAPPPLWIRLALIVGSPLLFILLVEGVVRVTGIETDLARNEHFAVEVPVWLLADEAWITTQQERLEQPQGVRAEDVMWFRSFEEARYIQYKLKPNLSVDAINPFNDIEVRKAVTFHFTSNSDGFRTREFTPRSEATYRIVSIGDSSTFGWGVDDEYTYQALLERRLAVAGGPAVEVFNLGIPGFTSRHGQGVLEHYARDLDPDLLIVSFGANDGRQVLQPTDQLLAADEGWRATIRFGLLRFETFKLLRRLLFSAYDPFAPPREERPPTFDSVPRDRYMEILSTMVEESRSRGTESVFLAVCAPASYVRGMRFVADTNDVPMVNARALFGDRLDDLRAHRVYPDEVQYAEKLYGPRALDRNPSLYVTSDGCHPNRAGHSLIAEALANAVARVRR